MGLFKPNIRKLALTKDVQGLINALKNKNKSIRDEAIKSLGDIGESAINELIKSLKEKNKKLSNVAAYTLGEFAYRGEKINTKIVPALVESLKDSVIRENSAIALGKYGTIAESAVPYLIKMLKNEDKNVQIAAAEALGEIGDPSAIPALKSALKDEDEDVRIAALEALDNF